MPRCVNCSLSLVHPLHRRQIWETTNDMVNVLQSWIHPARIHVDDFLCQECFILLQNASVNNGQPGSVAERAYGHREVCFVCGISILRAKTHRVPLDSPEGNVIRSRIPIQQVHRLQKVCLPCWTNAYRSVRRQAHHDQNRQEEEIIVENVEDHMMQLPVPAPPPQEELLAPPQEELLAPPQEEPLAPPQEQPLAPPLEQPLAPPLEQPLAPPQAPPLPQNLLHQGPQNVEGVPTTRIRSRIYKRAAASSRHCIFNDCARRERLLVPTIIKEVLMMEHKLYVPTSARICHYHLNHGLWHELVFEYDDFTAQQMDDMLSIMDRANRRQLDFSNVREMNSHLCRYWMGITPEQFYQLLAHIPHLTQDVPCPTLALSIFLVKLRTGDSNERLSTLFRLPRSTLERYMSKARNHLTTSFVPLFLGLGHISIQEVAGRNKIIPEGLFGNSEMPIATKPAIIMCDGTYIYVQKSSNFSYQKKTYSLHKCTNLVKPFMMVCCDGFILQTLGPFPATESDADIMAKEMASENSPLRNYFRPDDVFILDRGFRDVMGNLNQYGYKAYMPESLLEGESQLTTEQANRSRCVTMCRWVVEVVNGRIKRDFKLFRQDYFNRASTHLMVDFNIACALLNKFHPPIEDRPDAREFLELAKRRLNMRNYLGEYVKNENLNRRRAMFVTIDSENPHLDSFPRLSLHDLQLIALGSYQIKVARSYYGEHVRRNGKYEIDVACDIEDDLPLVLGTDKYLVRGRIKSRHVSSKIYYSYILVNRRAINSVTDIAGYYCNCLVGNRTVGCCAHIMTVLWYLSWARYRSVEAPAMFLDDIFYEYEEYDL